MRPALRALVAIICFLVAGLALAARQADADMVVHRPDGLVDVYHQTTVKTPRTVKPAVCKGKGKKRTCTRAGYTCKQVKKSKRSKAKVWTCTKKAAPAAKTPKGPAGPTSEPPAPAPSPSPAPMPPSPAASARCAAELTGAWAPFRPQTNPGGVARWPTSGFEFTFNPDSAPAGSESLLVPAFRAWAQRVPCGIDPALLEVAAAPTLVNVRYGGLSGVLYEDVADARNVVGFGDLPHTYCPSPTVIGCTRITMRHDGRIVMMDIRLRSPASLGTLSAGGAPAQWCVCASGELPGPNQIDLRATLTHEAGHAMGLQHSESWTQAMYPSLISGSTGADYRTLGSGDVTGRDTLYP